MPQTEPLPPQYWKADAHEWGPGKTHIIHEDGDRTLCGTRLADCPGRHVPATEHNCRACARVVETRARRKEQEREWQERQQQWQAERAEQKRLWDDWYARYLESPEWKQRRAAVMARAGGRCEACGQRPAIQVHHTTYEHVGHEPLFELRAICVECHERLTAADRARRGALS